MKAKKWTLNKDFCGQPSDENLSLVEFEISEQLEENEVLLEAVFLSVDPYMRVCKKKEGQTMVGEQLSKVIESRNKNFPKETMVLSQAGWVTKYKSKGDNLNPIRFELGKTPISYTLGALGMTGYTIKLFNQCKIVYLRATAYFGLNKCNPTQNEVIVVSCAAGAVGSIVGQLAKLKGLKVIGLVGNDEKAIFCKEIGFDYAFNYKSCNINEEIKNVVPDGVDIYFDNVGGTFYSSIIEHNMKSKGRVLSCGSIQTYCCQDLSKYEKNVDHIIKEKNLSIINFRSSDYWNDWPEAFTEINKLIQNGQLKVKEHVYHGFDKMRDAFYGLFRGENIGKAIVKND